MESYGFELLTNNLIYAICNFSRERDKVPFLSVTRGTHLLKSGLKYCRYANIDKIKDLWYFDCFRNVAIGSYYFRSISNSVKTNVDTNIFMRDIGEISEDNFLAETRKEDIWFNKGLRLIKNNDRYVLYIGTHKSKKIKIYSLPRFIRNISIGCFVDDVCDSHFNSIWTRVINDGEVLDFFDLNGIVINYHFKDTHFQISACTMRRTGIIDQTKSSITFIRDTVKFKKKYAKIKDQ